MENSCSNTLDRKVLLELIEVSKDYFGTRVLNKINFQLLSGEVHVLFGENGAGKSTLISMIAGAHAPTGGEIRFKGSIIRLNSVYQARCLGISAVFQEFSLIPNLSVEDNLFLGAELSVYGFLRKNEIHKKAKKIIEDLGFNLSPIHKVYRLSRAEQQMVEIAKAFRSDLSILILDEPTTSLTDYETKQLFKLILKLKNQGVGIIYISHQIDEIFQIGDRITVLRDGAYIDTVKANAVSEDRLVHMMTGRSIDQIFPDLVFKPSDPILQVKNLSTIDRTVRDVSLDLCRGEIVGITGLAGSGKSEWAKACFGLKKISKGTIVFKGKKVRRFSMIDMLDNGFIYLPSDRREEGLVMMRSVRENISLPSLFKKPFSKGFFLDRKFETKKVIELVDQLSLSPRNIEKAVEFFSGGNQQKVMLSRCLTRDFDLVVFDDPTVGVDVGTRVIIYNFIAYLCQQGIAILLISSDLSEILHMSHRVYVFRNGGNKVELKGDEITETNALSHFF